MEDEKRTVKRTTSTSDRSRKWPSMLKTEITSNPNLDDVVNLTYEAYDVPTLAEQVRQEALEFLDSYDIPYSELPAGDCGLAPPEWLEKYDQIAGVRPAFRMLFELHCFNLKCKDQPDAAYAHLLRIIPMQQQLTVARMEARYFAGAARAGDGGKESEKEYRKQKLHKEYRTLRDSGENPSRARELGAKRTGISMPTAKRYSTLKKLEKAYQQFT